MRANSSCEAKDVAWHFCLSAVANSSARLPRESSSNLYPRGRYTQMQRMETLLLNCRQRVALEDIIVETDCLVETMFKSNTFPCSHSRWLSLKFFALIHILMKGFIDSSILTSSANSETGQPSNRSSFWKAWALLNKVLMSFRNISSWSRNDDTRRMSPFDWNPGLDLWGPQCHSRNSCATVERAFHLVSTVWTRIPSPQVVTYQTAF